MRNILCLSTSDYFPFPTRKQNVMDRMSDAHVIYVDPAVTLAAPLKDPTAGKKLRAYKNEAPKHPKNHIWVYGQPPVLPLYNKKRGVNEINQKKLAKYLAKLCNAHGFGTDFWLWVYHPCYADVVAPLAKAVGMDPAALWKRTVYDCVDRHSAYPGMIDPKVVDEMEEDLARSCGCVFATAQGLYDRLSAFNQNCHLLPNGCAYERFSQTAGMEKTEDRTIFGFVGAIQECTDLGMIKAVAQSFPEAEVRMIGKILPGVDITVLKDLPNVKLRGLVPQPELPGIIKEFDVCLNVFVDNELSKDVSPLKFYEYLATGKPVVSTPVPYQVRDFADCIYIAENEADLIEKCRLALEEPKDSEKARERMRRAKLCSWDGRVEDMKRILGWI